ncbi:MULTISPECIES: beta-galactosidase [unclassified Solwaraspora]|uniref:beta-galactosidase n=1 Tax=unclassified Solwaraspora TaxID=2627926 RepID=UPI00248B4E6C|nr:MULTISPECIES: beta-galactosidase [unclassified Solwaraspora]WBC21261.1 beta-galactosidase [Solwaraspora sp. WMMA2080]WJK36657.1 beta-galactosidase [Solwaraspora sp. WMMA2065]
MRWPKGLDGLCYGGDYNPEQWPETTWVEDVELMRRARVNLVTVGVFAWSRLEPHPGEYTVDWLDRALDLLHRGGIRVVLATPTASPPPWFSLAHPDALPVTADGVRLRHGSRDTYCAAAPAYRVAARRIAAMLADRYRDHPALAMWHVHNEYGTVCHCPHAAAAFRRWLRQRYGDLDRLNEAWTGAFWSQRYSDWAQVEPPRATQYLANPTQALDFRRFWSDELLAAYRDQRDLLREHTPNVPVTTNYVFGDWVPVDHARWAREVDLVAVDHYPTETDGRAEEQTALAADLARSWSRPVTGDRSPAPAGRHRPWLLMESAPNLIYRYAEGTAYAKEPGRMLRHSVAHVARGSRGAMFFQWRAPRGGAEAFHSAMVPHAGADSRTFRSAVQLGEALRLLAATDTATVAARAAIGWDAASGWALQHPGMPSGHISYADEVAAAHRALWRCGITTDFVCPAAGPPELTGYRMLVLPALYLMDDAVADALGDWVRAGGHLVVSYLSGVADSDARVRLGGYPGALRELLGVRSEELLPLGPDGTVRLSGGRTGRLWRERFGAGAAEPVLDYVDGVLAGQPAVTRRAVGAGAAWYLSTRLDDDGYRELLAVVAAEAGVAPVLPAAPAGVEAVRRVDGTTRWLFLFNHGREEAVVAATGEVLVSGGVLPSGEIMVASDVLPAGEVLLAVGAGSADSGRSTGRWPVSSAGVTGTPGRGRGARRVRVPAGGLLVLREPDHPVGDRLRRHGPRRAPMDIDIDRGKRLP